MKCLVTGGAGFIGSHLVERLLNDGHTVIVLDNFSTGSRENLNQIEPKSDLDIFKVDISNYNLIESYFIDVDWVFHLAGLADVVPSIQIPLRYHSSNVDGTISVLEASRSAGIKKLIYTASSSCYGMPEMYPTPETADISPQYPYALTKYIGEQYVVHWNKIYNIPITSLRLFNVFGPRSRTSGAYGAVFGVFLSQKIHNKPFTVVGNGNQTRDFIFVTDVVNALIKTAESDTENEIFNVGSGNPHSINNLVELIGGDVVYIPKRPGEPDCTHADITKIKKTIGWEPKVTFKDGVKIMLNNIEYWKDGPVWNKDTIGEATKEWFDYLSKGEKRED
jgi:UDP-glucose 4-epimerase